MIHHEIGCAYVVDEEGNRETVCLGDPRAALMAREEAAAGDAMACAIEAVRDWLGWIFEAGPHPVPVLRRLVACTSAHAPWLLQGMTKREATTLAAWREERDILRAWFGVTPREVKDALAKAYRREGRTWSPPPHITTIEMQLLVEDAMEPDDALIRAKAMEAWLARVWDAGPRLPEALKAIFVEARAIAPELILNMTGDEISRLFGQGRAAESARVKQRVNVFLARAGFRRTTLRFQKSETACRRYAERARGNHHRAKASAVPPAA